MFHVKHFLPFFRKPAFFFGGECGIITSRNTCKIKDFECFGEHCIINLGLRPAASPRIALGAMKLWYNKDLTH